MSEPRGETVEYRREDSGIVCSCGGYMDRIIAVLDDQELPLVVRCRWCGAQPLDLLARTSVIGSYQAPPEGKT